MHIVINIPPAFELVAGTFVAVTAFVGRVIFRYMVVPWVGHYLAAMIGHSLRPSEREEIIARHYKARRRGKIHQAAWPWRCNDGKCVLL